VDDLYEDVKICDDDLLIRRVAKFDEILVGHPRMLAAINGVLECMSWSRESKEPRGAAILGEGGTGKTTVCNVVLKRFPPSEERTGDAIVKVVPAFYCAVPAATCIGGLVESLLSGLGDPFPEHGNPRKKTKRLITLLRECRTRIIFLDEFHNLANTSTPGMRKSVQLCEWLMHLTNRSNVMLCLVGIPSCENLVDYDPQMFRRFSEKYRLGDLSLGTQKEPGELITYLRTLCKRGKELVGVSAFPDFQNYTLACQMWAATAGRPSFIALLLKNAMLAALRDKREYVSEEDLVVAFDRGCTAEIALTAKNPFLLTRAQLAASLRGNAKGKV
jgi:type II secretory pathway predicted ATPase ExeA